MRRIGLLMIVTLTAVAARAALAQPGHDAHEGHDTSERRGGAQADAPLAVSPEARAALQKSHGGQRALYMEGERFELQSHDGEPLLLWDGQGWFGGYRHRLWVKTEGEYVFAADEFEEAELQALYSRPITPFFDLQAGLRHDFEPDGRSFAVIGAQGLAPYWFELDLAAFISEDGDVSARVEAEYDLLLTQRLILQPRTELNFAVQSVERAGVGSGLSTAEAGLRLRYEIRREFAPYLGVAWSRKTGETADFARAEGEGRGSVSVLAGVRFWY